MIYLGLFCVICSIPFLYCMFSLIYLLLNILISRTYKFKEIVTMNIEASNDILDYKPAIAGYLINSQKIGDKEVFSTLFDLINRKVIIIEITKGFVSDNVGEYKLKRNLKSNERLKEYELFLIQWLFKSEKEKISLIDIKNRVYKDRMSNENYKFFLKKVQNECIKEDFFSKRFSIIKKKMQVFTDLFVVFTNIFIVVGLCYSIFILFISIARQKDLTPILFPLLLTIGLWILRFCIKFIYSKIVYYNIFSEKGKEDYKKMMKFKEYLENYSLIPEHPMMGYQIWGRYYIYSIELGCSDKFYEQLKAIGINIKNNKKILSFIEFMHENFKQINSEYVRHIIVDSDGESHVDYM